MDISNLLKLAFSFTLFQCITTGALTWNWELYSGQEYYFAIERDIYKNGDAAQYLCNKNGGNLLNIQNESELKFLMNKVENKKIWISNISQYVMENWIYPHQDEWRIWRSQARKTTEFLQLEIGYKTVSLRVENCDIPAGFICKRTPISKPDTVEDASTTPRVGGYCPTGYFNFDMNDNKCYRVVVVDRESDGWVWDDARKDCKDGPGLSPDLVSIHSHYENAVLTSQIQRTTQGFHVGLVRDGNNYTWADESNFTYNNWGEGEPANWDQFCGEVRVIPVPGTWASVKCDRKQGYICQTFKDELNTAPPPTTPNSCPNGFKPYWYGCYKVTDDTYDWEGARKACKDSHSGAELASIHSTTENAAVFAELHLRGGEAWIGLNDLMEEGSYNWTDGWVVLYTEWGENQPSVPVGGGCVSMHQDGKWFDDKCADKKKAVCKYTTETPITPPSPPEGICPGELENSNQDWKKFHKHCFLFETNDKMTWSAARAKCKELGGLNSDLASIHDIQENNFVVENMEGINVNVWIGLYQQTDKTFHWSDALPANFFRWAPGEPLPDEEKCVEIYSRYSMQNLEGYWNDVFCNVNRGFVCRAEQVQPDNPDIKCPENWEVRGDSCYWFEPESLAAWDTAQEQCQHISNGQANLVSIKDMSENAWIRSKYAELTFLPHPHDYWIGLFKEGPLNSDYKFQWNDGSEITFHYWETDQPSDTNGYENCVEANAESGQWRDLFCTQYRGFVCKMTPGKGGLSGGQIAGIVIGVLLGSAVIVAAVLYLGTHFGYIKKPKMNDTKFEEFTDSSATPTPQATRKENGTTEIYQNEVSA